MSLFEERMAMRTDLLAGRVPKRVPIIPLFTLEAACSHAGVDLMRAHYDMTLREQAFEAVCKDFYCDAFPLLDLRFPAVYQLLGAKNWILGSNGVMQHPEIETMTAEDYDDYIDRPYETIVERFLPRVCANLDRDPFTSGMNLAKAYHLQKDISAQQFGIMGKLSRKYEFVPGLITGKLIEAPFDFLADQLRGFKGITMDVRRCPGKIKEAVEATLPLILRLGTPQVVPPGMIDFIPLHMPPYINMKQFEALYWPTFQQLVVELDRRGIASTIYAEQDWTRYAGFLEQLPASTIVMLENGDLRRLKDTVGKQHVIGGVFDPTITLTRSKEACIDEVKRQMEIGMPGGRYYFGFDRGIMDMKSVDAAKLQAVLEWVRDNGKY